MLSCLEQDEMLVTDLVMPQMSGDEIARRLRQVEPGLEKTRRSWTSRAASKACSRPCRCSPAVSGRSPGSSSAGVHLEVWIQP